MKYCIYLIIHSITFNQYSNPLSYRKLIKEGTLPTRRDDQPTSGRLSQMVESDASQPHPRLKSPRCILTKQLSRKGDRDRIITTLQYARYFFITLPRRNDRRIMFLRS